MKCKLHHIDLKYLYMSPGFPFTFSLKTECHSSFTVQINIIHVFKCSIVDLSGL